MNKVKDILKKISEKIKALSKGKKIAFGILAFGIISVMIYLIVYFNTTKYAVLFKDMDPNDAQVVLSKLNEKKIQYQVQNNTIKVPEDNVSELRLELAPQLTSGSKGYEILESGNTFGMTDQERALKYKIALEGELARTIKSLPEIKEASVFLVMPEDSDFFKESKPAQASVRLEFQVGKNISKEQIKAIVALVTGSVKNLPKENVKIIGVLNGKTLDLGEDLYKDEDNTSAFTDKQQKYKNDLEKKYEKKIISLLSPTYGEGVNVSIDVNLDFDASEKTSTAWDPNKVIRSEEIDKDTTNAPNNTSGSPVDNNMSNTITGANGNTQSTHEKQIRNYEIGKVEQKVISAPGKIKKISASVVVNDGNLTDDARGKIKSAVSGAIGYDGERGDIINVEGMKFTSDLANVSAEEAAKKAKEEEAKRRKKMLTYVGIGAAVLIVLMIILAAIRKAKKAKEEELEELEGIDVVIDDNVAPKEPLKPIDFEEENENTHIEKEIKRYANEKPDQVVEIIKAWMAEDER